MFVDVLIISISNPILIGIYKEDKLIKTFSELGKSSDAVPNVIQKINNEYKEIQSFYYVNQPGSHMAIKVTYLALKTFCMAKNIPLMATNGFYFNQNSPIKALGKKYFINKDNIIECAFIDEDAKIEDFRLPEKLDKTIFSTDNLPKYNISAV